METKLEKRYYTFWFTYFPNKGTLKGAKRIPIQCSLKGRNINNDRNIYFSKIEKRWLEGINIVDSTTGTIIGGSFHFNSTEILWTTSKKPMISIEKGVNFCLFLEVQDGGSFAIRDVGGKIVLFSSIKKALSYRTKNNMNDVYEDDWIKSLENCHVCLFEDQYERIPDVFYERPKTKQ